MLTHVEGVAFYTKISMFRKDSSRQKCRKEQVVVALFQQITDNGHISLGRAEYGGMKLLHSKHKTL